MASKSFASVKLSETLHLSECWDGFWLYDKTRGMNLAMRAKDPLAAFTVALTYYQERLQCVETSHAGLKAQIEEFVGRFVKPDDDGNPPTVEVGDL